MNKMFRPGSSETTQNQAGTGTTTSALQLPAENPNARAAYYGPTDFTWLVRGRLGGAPQPGLHRSLDQDAEALARIGVTTVVTLTEEWQPPVAQLARHGLESLYFPMPDMEPPTMEQAEEICETLSEALANNKVIVFHCRAGRGRTGTLLAAMVLWYQPDFDAVVKWVKSTNKYWIQSESQMEFLRQFASARQKQLGADPRKSDHAMEPRDVITDTRNMSNDTVSNRSQPDRSVSIDRHSPEKEITMSLDKALMSAMTGIPECLASGYIDMDTGMLLGVQTIDSHPQEVLDLLAAATADLFQGASIVQIEQIFKNARGTNTDDHYFNEILVFSENLIHIFLRTKMYPGHVCSFVCRRSANPGMVMTKARMALEGVTSAF